MLARQSRRAGAGPMGRAHDGAGRKLTIAGSGTILSSKNGWKNGRCDDRGGDLPRQVTICGFPKTPWCGIPWKDRMPSSRRHPPHLNLLVEGSTPSPRVIAGSSAAERQAFFYEADRFSKRSKAAGGGMAALRRGRFTLAMKASGYRARPREGNDALAGAPSPSPRAALKAASAKGDRRRQAALLCKETP